jgi:hypothetical protein
MNDISLRLMFNRSFDLSVSKPVQLLIFGNEVEYCLELRDDGKLVTGLRFLYGEKVHIAALCLGRIVYDLFKNSDLAESMIKAVEDNLSEDSLGGYQLRA